MNQINNTNSNTTSTVQTTNSNTNLKSSRHKMKEGTDDYIAIKINENGEELWNKIVGSHGEDVLKRVIETRDGGYLMAGTSNAFSISAMGTKLNNLQGENSQLKNAKNDIHTSINQNIDELNKQINSKSKNAVESINQTLGITENSPLKLNAPISEFGGGLLSGKAGNENTNGVPEKKLPPSGDKNSSYGNNDFWVVKLIDTAKPEKVKIKIEALPNPSYGFTNVIIGYEFQKGTATVVDLSGRQLQQFEFTSRTVPVDLSSYPEGIYIVNIKTDVSNDGVKVIKGISKN